MNLYTYEAAIPLIEGWFCVCDLGLQVLLFFIINSQTKNQVLITKMNEMKWNWMKTTNIWWKGEWAISFWIYAKRHPNSRNKNIILIAFSQQKP